MTKLAGLVYVKHGRVGTRSEGPDYFLQTVKGDVLLVLDQPAPWLPDYKLEFYGRRMVAVEGDFDGERFKVAHIQEILAGGLPRDSDEPAE